VTATITGTQGSITVNARPADHFTVTGYTNPTTAGAAHTFTVTAKDQYNNTDTNYLGTVHITAPTDPQAVLPADQTFTAANAGVKSGVSATLKTAGSQSIVATDTASSSRTGSQTVTVNPASASTYTFVVPSTPVASGTPFSVTVTVRDAFGNVATQNRGTIHFTSTDTAAGVVLPANYTFTAADAGTHTFTNGVTLRTPGNQTITVNDTNVTTRRATSSPITVS
jgi:hypothetical protein